MDDGEKKTEKITEKDLQIIATQLSHPIGDLGIQMGEKMNSSNVEMTLQTINNLSLNKDDKVLELGHGNAGHLQMLMNRNENLTYHGLEISSTMKDEAILKNMKLINDGVAHFQLFDGELIPFEENLFQKILTVNTIYFWKKPNVLLSEIYRVLEKEGNLIITFAKKDFMHQLPFIPFGFRLWEIIEVIKIASSAGFDHLSTTELEDNVESKSGDFVNRKYVVVKFRK